jgi:hypothetical protein
LTRGSRDAGRGGGFFDHDHRQGPGAA